MLVSCLQIGDPFLDGGKEPVSLVFSRPDCDEDFGQHIASAHHVLVVALMTSTNRKLRLCCVEEIYILERIAT